MKPLTLDTLYENRIKIIRRCRAAGADSTFYNQVKFATTNEELKQVLYSNAQFVVRWRILREITKHLNGYVSNLLQPIRKFIYTEVDTGMMGVLNEDFSIYIEPLDGMVLYEHNKITINFRQQ
jgi:hypothetical protein